MPLNFPPKSYGSKCGRSWNREIWVDGQVTPWWGSQFRRGLKPLVWQLPTLIGMQGQEEQALVAQLRSDVDQMRGELDGLRAAGALTAADLTALQYLCDGVLANLDAIGPIYARWDEFQCIRGAGESPLVCPWPLSRSDNPGMWMPSCENPQVGVILQDKYGRPYQCPAASIAVERQRDRTEIRNLIITALRWLRCCQWWATKADLRKQARDAGVPPDPTKTLAPGVGAGGGTPKPATPGYGGLTGTGSPPVPPEDLPEPTPAPSLPELLAGIQGVPIVPGAVPGPGAPLPGPEGLPWPGPDGLPPIEPGEPPPGDGGEQEAAPLGERLRQLPTWQKVGGGLLLAWGLSRVLGGGR
jgi:hypothetical protein